MEERRSGGSFSPSWIDRLTDRIDDWPWPAWLTYLVAFVVLCLVANGAAWLDRSLPVGALHPYLSSIAVYPVAALAGIHYLDAEARHALERLRPALTIGHDDFVALRHRLTTLPSVATNVSGLLGLLFAVGYVVFGFDTSIRPPGPIVLAVDVGIALVGFPLLAILLFHTIRQLRLISHILARIASIDLFQLEPLLAFSRVTARNGMLLLALGYLSAATEPATFDLANPTLPAFVAITIVVAIGAFVLPIHGLHRRLAAEKERRLADADRDLSTALAEVSRRARAGDLTDAYPLNQQLTGLVTQRDIISRIPTWPWQPAALRGFVTAILVPIAVWIVPRVLERLLAGA